MDREQDTPDLFDSERLSVHLTTVAETPVNAEDVLAEIVQEINGVPRSDVENAVGDRAKDSTEFHTDESEEEEEIIEGDTVDEHRPSVDVDPSGEQSTKTKTSVVHKGLPPGRVKLIMKMDPDVNLVASDAVFLLTKATESFVGLLAKHCHKAMVASNKKTLQKKHIDAVIEESVPFEFLEGALDW